MDQTAFQALCGAFQQHCSAEHALPDLAISSGRPDAPIVAMIHGIGGNAQPHGASGVASSPPYQPDSATAWCALLRTQEVSWVTWSQSQPADLLSYAGAPASSTWPDALGAPHRTFTDEPYAGVDRPGAATSDTRGDSGVVAALCG